MDLDVVALDPDAFGGALASLATDRSGLALTPAEIRLLRPDHPFLRYGSWCGFLASRRGCPSARLVASIDPRQCAAGRPVGAIGFIAGADTDALAVALRAAEGWLRGRGVLVARCPMQFSTWFGHRAMTAGFPDQGGAPAFALEPATPRPLIQVLEQTGYCAAHRAVSHLVDHERVIAGAQRGLERMHAAGFHERPIDLDNVPCELAVLHELALEIFRGSWGYSETSRAEFAAFFGPLAHAIDPDLVRIVEDPDGRAAGFVLAFPASLGRPPGVQWEHDAPAAQDMGALVVKTLGVLPDVRRRCPGLGSALVAVVHEVAQRKGYAYGIHALMLEGSYAQRLSADWGSRLRSYATFERLLNQEAR